jgi:uncharacterized membrane protein YkvA (DUF1232 family)
MRDTALDLQYLDVFCQWLRSLGDDASRVGNALAETTDDEAARPLIAGLNYIFQSLDCIADGIAALAFLDDAFVLRVACALARPRETHGVVHRLHEDTHTVRAFLDDDYARLEKHVRGLGTRAVRGRTVEEIAANGAIRTKFLSEVDGWSRDYEAPPLVRDPKTLVKLRAFLDAKLP